MVRIISAIFAFALIILGAMIITGQGIFAQSVNFIDQDFADTGKWSGLANPNANISTNGGVVKGVSGTVYVPDPPSRDDH